MEGDLNGIDIFASSNITSFIWVSQKGVCCWAGFSAVPEVFLVLFGFSFFFIFHAGNVLMPRESSPAMDIEVFGMTSLKHAYDFGTYCPVCLAVYTENKAARSKSSWNKIDLYLSKCVAQRPNQRRETHF